MLARKVPMVVKVIGMTRQFGTVQKSGVPSGTKRETKIGNVTESLDDLLVNVADETLKQVFKEPGARVIYDYLENNSHLQREEIAEKAEVFSAGLDRLLSSGALVIEKLILKNLYCKLELKFTEKEGYEFSNYIKDLKKPEKANRKNLDSQKHRYHKVIEKQLRGGG